jgi:hypothetical protein
VKKVSNVKMLPLGTEGFRYIFRNFVGFCSLGFTVNPNLCQSTRIRILNLSYIGAGGGGRLQKEEVAL